MLAHPGLFKLAVAAAMSAVLILADASIVDAAFIAAISSTVNTWILLYFSADRRREREERKQLQRQVRDLQNQMRSRRVARRTDTEKIVVMDAMPLEDTAREILNNE